MIAHYEEEEEEETKFEILTNKLKQKIQNLE